jgi:hypothetical protein
VGLDGGGVTTESSRTEICGRDVPPVEAAPEVDGGFAVAFDVGLGLGLGLGFGAAAVWAGAA